MWKPAAALPLGTKQRCDLETLVRSGKTPQRVVLRALIILAAADGAPLNATARDLGVSRATVYLWRERFQQAGIVGLLKDAPRPGSPTPSSWRSWTSSTGPCPPAATSI